MKIIRSRFVQVLAIAALPVFVQAAPTARIAASRSSGPAPLAVLFDATGTTDTALDDPFRQLGYKFTFADPASGTWSYSGLSKNQQVGGPLAAHVFETPGTYAVRVTARDASGASSTATVTIEVQDPNTVFSGTNTVCLSRTSDFTGCPSGAQQTANVSAWPTFQSSRRYLLRRGQDFSSLPRLTLGGDSGLRDVQVGAFGSGERPRVRSVFVSSGQTGASSWSQRIVIADLAVPGGLEQYIGTIDFLLLRNTFNLEVQVNSAFTWYAERATLPHPRNVFIVENDVDPNFATNDTAAGFSGNAVGFAFMGNRFARTYTHQVRIPHAHKAFFGHNSLSGQTNSNGHALKFHAGGTAAVVLDAARVQSGYLAERSSQVVVADNQFGSTSSNINWITAFQPQNDVRAEGLEDFIIEDNQYRHGSGSPQWTLDIAWAGRRMTDRGNVGGGSGGSARVSTAFAEALPSDWVGPFYINQASMKSRFAADDPQEPAPRVPRQPTDFTVQ